jgi:hypothetical protein
VPQQLTVVDRDDADIAIGDEHHHRAVPVPGTHPDVVQLRTVSEPW